MSVLADACRGRGLDYATAFALMNMAWAPGQLAGRGAAAARSPGSTSDAVPYLCASA